MPPDDIITSTRNSAVVAAARLHRSRERRQTGLTLIEGPNLVAEVIAAGCDIREVFVGEGDSPPTVEGATTRIVSEHVLARLAGTMSPQGPVAVVAIPEPQIPSDRRLLVAWEISDPGNCGTLVRTAAAFGYGYVSGPGSADPWSPKALRSGAGGHFHTTIGLADGLRTLAGRPLVGAVAAGGDPPGPLARDAAVLVGSESRGLPDVVVAACDRLVTIPMPGGVESLNAAVAGALVAFLGIGSGEPRDQEP